MPRADDAPLQKRKSGLGGVCMDFADNVDLCSVLDGLVPLRESNSLHCAGVGIEFVGHPTGRKIEREEAFALPQLFPSYCDVSYVVITWLNGKTIRIRPNCRLNLFSHSVTLTWPDIACNL